MHTPRPEWDPTRTSERVGASCLLVLDLDQNGRTESYKEAFRNLKKKAK
jgi:hypothetical protein